MRKKKMFSYYLLTVLVISSVDGYPNGAGLDDACLSLTPSHGAASQSSTSPYSVIFSPTTFTPGQAVTVTLAASGTGFKGFMIQARRADNSTQDRLGSFTGDLQTKQACPGGNALVHSSSLVKTSLVFNWTSPTHSVGNVMFRVTYVQNKTTFWANRYSNILVEKSGAFSTLNFSSSNFSLLCLLAIIVALCIRD